MLAVTRKGVYRRCVRGTKGRINTPPGPRGISTWASPGNYSSFTNSSSAKSSSSWEDQFQLDLAVDAREGLMLRVLRTVNEAIGAMAKHQAGS